MPDWTPGPWVYAPIPGYQYVVIIEKATQIFLVAAAVPPGREAEVMANMRLASAAPDLYAALEAIRTSAEDYGREIPEWLTERLEAAKMALLKANPNRQEPDA